jgi:hypothetical protein
MSTLKQIAANRRNALKSTGPISEEGKKQSRRNSLKHGLAGSGLVLPLEERSAVDERIAEWHSSLKPFDNYETWLLEVIAVESIRIDRCRIQDRVLREERIHCADDSWDTDQCQAADELAAKLVKDPAAAAKLRKTVAGASILIDRWQALSRALKNGGWSEPQEDLAHNLLGTPPALREGLASPLNPGLDQDALAHRLKIVREQLQQLEHLLLDVLPAKNEDKRELIKAGVPDLEDRALMRLHRYESRCFRRLMWATSQMRSKNKGVTLLTEPSRKPHFLVSTQAVESPPQPIAETPIYHRPSLRDSLDEKAMRYDAGIMEVGAARRTTAEESVPNRSPKNLPSPKDRPSRRASHDTK